MFTIQFDTISDANEAFLYFSSHFKENILINQDQSSIFFSVNPLRLPDTGGEKVIIGQMFRSFILDCYEKKWLINLLSSKYYFTESHQQEPILEILESIFLGEMTCLPKVKKLMDREEVLTHCLSDVFHTNHELAFHGLKTFRLLPYHELLQKYIEIAIDEYKLQEEYQAFIEKLTSMIRAFRPLYSVVYVADFDSTIKLYNDDFEAIDSSQTLRSFYPLLKQWGIDAEPSPLLALIALAPEKVVVCSDRPAMPLLVTMSRVFGSRLFLNKASCFKTLSDHHISKLRE